MATPRRSPGRFIFAVSALVATLTPVSAVHAQIAVRLPDEPLAAQVFDVAGQAWVVTGRGAYRVAGDTLRRVPDHELPVNGIHDAGGQVWIATDQGAYRVTGDAAQRIPDADIRVIEIDWIDGRVWLTTDTGAYRITGNNTQRIPDEELHVWEIVDVANEAWLFTDGGIYRVIGDTVRKVALPGNIVPRGLRVIRDQIWFATEHGAFRITGETARRIPDEDLAVQHIDEIGGEIFLSSRGAVYRVAGDTAVPINQGLPVNTLYEVNGEPWLATRGGAYRVEGQAVRRIPDLDVSINAITAAAGHVWVATNRGAYRIIGDTAERIPDQDLAVLSAREVGGRVWLATRTGAYRVTGNRGQRIPDDRLSVFSIQEIGGTPWLATSGGAYRVDETSSIDVTFRRAETRYAFLGQFLPASVLISGDLVPVVRYSRDGGSYDSATTRFDIIANTDKSRFEMAMKNGDYTPAGPARLLVGSGPQTLHVSVRDQWQNTFSDAKDIWVVPAPTAMLGLAGLFWGTLLLAIVGLAPATTFCHDLLMNPWLRKYGSFGTVPLALTALPPLRRHILRRYLRSLREDADLIEAERRFVVPDPSLMPDLFADRLRRDRVVLLLGASGIGKTSYVRYLLARFASRRPAAALAGMTPVFIPLRRYEGEDPLRAFHAQLSNYGRLTDFEMTGWFLQQGGFLIFVDGLNEVDQATRASVRRFVDRHWKANCFCLTSQEEYPDFDRIAKVTLAALGRSHVLELLRRRLGDAKAASIVADFTDEMYEMYRIPHDLELAIELVADGRPVPASRLALYDAALAPMLDAWRAAGRMDYADLLCERAYEMLSRRETLFDRPNRALPDGMRAELVERRLLVRRGDQYLFRHDLVRAYLAASYVRPRWQAVLSDEAVAMDANWDALLEFAILGLDDREAKRFLLALLARNRDAAGALFKRFMRTRPEGSPVWADDFIRAYGIAML